MRRNTPLSFRTKVRNLRPFDFAQGDGVATHLVFTQGALMFACFIFRRLLLFICEKIKILRQAQNDNVFLVRVLPLVAKRKMMRFFDAFHLLRMTILSFRESDSEPRNLCVISRFLEIQMFRLRSE